jgi:hypothetical protein
VPGWPTATSSRRHRRGMSCERACVACHRPRVPVDSPASWSQPNAHPDSVRRPARPPDEQLLSEVEDVIRRPVVGLEPSLWELPQHPSMADRSIQPALIRALLRCLQDDGAEVSLDILAEQGPQGSGTYQTPGWLAEMMAVLLGRTGDGYPATVLDPACGSGAFLTVAARLGAGSCSGRTCCPRRRCRPRHAAGARTRVES